MGARAFLAVMGRYISLLLWQLIVRPKRLFGAPFNNFPGCLKYGVLRANITI